VTENLTEEEALLLRAWRTLSPEARSRAAGAIVAELDRAHRAPKKRGPRPMSHAKARQITRLWDAYRASRRGGSPERLRKAFIKTLPDRLRLTSKTRGTEMSDSTLQNLISSGQELARQRPALRRLAAVLKANDGYGLAALGTHPPRSAPAVIRALRSGKREDAAEIKRLTDEAEFYRDSALRALRGDDAQSLIRMPQGGTGLGGLFSGIGGKPLK
jgi:hypothetical protein